jgi:hypothetical protein
MKTHLALGLALALTTPVGGLAQTLEGVWQGTEIEVIGGPNPGVTILDVPRLLIYTDAYYMWAFESGGQPRPLGDTDAEVAQAARLYQSNAGTYMREGSTITYTRMVALNPNLMLPENQQQVRQIRVLTADRLETQATNAEGVTTILKYRRVE